jgi:hypothetical protein
MGSVLRVDRREWLESLSEQCIGDDVVSFCATGSPHWGLAGNLGQSGPVHVA